jgi:XRE family aerobic/anaerobic benzoate catabolism transcriptional regulator
MIRAMVTDHEPRKRSIGERARARRRDLGLTLKALAERSGLSARFLSEVEAGRANPSGGSLSDLADALETDVLALLHAGPSSDAHAELLAFVQRLDVEHAEAALTLLRDARLDRSVRPVALLGLRGAGKSSVGERLAQRTGRPFIEVDRLIEAEAGMSLGGLFELHGEEHVRGLEHQVLRGALDGRAPAVLATGGGVVRHADSWALLASRAFTVWLKATPQQHWDRVVAQGDRRPMENRSRARTELEALYNARVPLYERADLTVDTSDTDVDGVCARILDALAEA